MKPTQDIIDELRDAVEQTTDPRYTRLLTDAADRIEHLFASGIHTCNADCQRPMCVLRRERDKARNDLARVTAELEHHKSVKETIDSAHKELSREHAALRARVAELEAQIERDAWTLSPEMVQTRNDQLAAKLEQAEQRNAELVAALTDLLGCPTVTDRATCPNGDPSRIDEAPEWQAVLQISCAWTRYKKLKALARAESATPDKHPDTVRLDWLASNKQSGGKAFCLQWTFRDNNNQTNIRDAIDAARKQGGAE